VRLLSAQPYSYIMFPHPSEYLKLPFWNTPPETCRSTVKVSLPADIGSDVWTSHLRDRSLVLGDDDLLVYRSSLMKLMAEPRCEKACPAYAGRRELDSCPELRNGK
jgi:hypothetical protein